MTIKQWGKIRNRILSILEFFEDNRGNYVFYEDMGIFYLPKGRANATTIAILKSDLIKEFDQEFIVAITAMGLDGDGTFIINFEFTPIIKKDEMESLNTIDEVSEYFDNQIKKLLATLSKGSFHRKPMDWSSTYPKDVATYIIPSLETIEQLNSFRELSKYCRDNGREIKVHFNNMPYPNEGLERVKLKIEIRSST